MKKQLIAKLLALGLILAMLPTAAFAATVKYSGTRYEGANGLYGIVNGKRVSLFQRNGTYYYFTEDTDSSAGGSATTPVEVDEIKPPEVLNTVDVVEAEQVEIAEDGTLTVNLPTKIENGVAYVALTENAVNNLQVAGESLVLVIDSKDATMAYLDMPVKALTKLNVNVVVKSPIATITLPSSALTTTLKDATTVTVGAQVTESGVIAISVLADGKVITKDIKGLVVEF